MAYYDIYLKITSLLMGNLLPLVAVALSGPAIIALIFYRRGA